MFAKCCKINCFSGQLLKGNFTLTLEDIWIIEKSEYDQEMSQLHNADQAMAPLGKYTEHYQPHGSKKTN